MDLPPHARDEAVIKIVYFPARLEAEKAKQCLLVNKLMSIVYWNARGTIYIVIEPVPQPWEEKMTTFEQE